MAVTSANLKLLGKLQFKTASDLILLNIEQQLSDVLFKILAGIILYLVAFFGFRALISFSISLKGTLLLITMMLGWFSYYFIAISNPLTGVKVSLHSKISNDFTAFSKYLLNFSATSISLEII